MVFEDGPLESPVLVAFQRAISEDHPRSLGSVTKRANLVYFGDGSGFTVKTKTNQPPTPQMVLISHNQLRKGKMEHAKSSGTEKENAGGSTQAVKHKNDARSLVMISYDKIEPMLWERF